MNDYTSHLDNPIDPLLPESQAAEILGTTKNTLKQSRHTGILFGKKAPAFIKLGRSAKYKLSTLIAFRDEFPSYHSTAEYQETPKGSEFQRSDEL